MLCSSIEHVLIVAIKATAVVLVVYFIFRDDSKK